MTSTRRSDDGAAGGRGRSDRGGNEVLRERPASIAVTSSNSQRRTAWPSRLAGPQRRRHPVRRCQRGEGDDGARRREPDRRWVLELTTPQRCARRRPAVDRRRVTVEHLLSHRSASVTTSTRTRARRATTPCRYRCTSWRRPNSPRRARRLPQVPPRRGVRVLQWRLRRARPDRRAISGVAFHDLVHRRVCEPAGMVDTASSAPTNSLAERHSVTSRSRSVCAQRVSPSGSRGTVTGVSTRRR